MSKSDQSVAVGGGQEWNFETPPAELRGSKMQLLTIGRIAVYGVWKGGFGEYFVGWAPIPPIPKDLPFEVFNGSRNT